MPKGITDSPFTFPYAGNEQTTPTVGAATAGSPLTIFSSAVGTSGVVREIFLALTFNASTLAASLNATLDAYFDGSGSAAWSIPVGTLCGNEPTGGTLTEAINNLTFQNRFVTVVTPQVLAGVVGPTIGVILTFEIPYTNGLTLKIASASGTQNVYTYVRWQDTLPACWNRNLRPIWSRSNETTAAVSNVTKTFKYTDSTHITGTATAFDATFIGKTIEGNGIGGVLTTFPAYDICIIGVTDTTHLVTSTRDAAGVILLNTNNTHYLLYTHHTFVSRAAGKRGFLAMVIGAAVNATDTVQPLLEANPRLWTNGLPATAVAQTEVDTSHAWSGTEDFFGGAFFWNAFASPVQQLDSGLTQTKTSDQSLFGAYRIWPQGIRYTDGLKGTWPNLADTTATTNNWSALVYEET